ncbi:MAG: methenyltetrahydrofolate cyclohydrolase [Chloroflexota bacterium]|nr:methenyltetrahydrofolate cyclohydrolase [Chloroflexota bacterium]
MYNPAMTTPSTPEHSLSDLSIRAFLDALASATPAPGGGSAAALVAAMGAALTAMGAGLTVGRPRYADAQEEMATVLGQAAALRSALTTAADADMNAYLVVMAAYRLPKESATQKAARAAAIEAAMRGAATAPLAVAERCAELLDLAGRVAGRGNPNASGDAAVGALLAYAGLQGAVRNVRINLRSIGDAAFCQAAEEDAARLLREGERLLAAALAAADARG